MARQSDPMLFVCSVHRIFSLSFQLVLLFISIELIVILWEMMREINVLTEAQILCSADCFARQSDPTYFLLSIFLWGMIFGHA